MSCIDCKLCVEQPPEWEHTSPDGVFIKQMLLKDAGTAIPQHAHVYDHTSMLATGSVRAWCDDNLLGDFVAPAPIFIKARAKHTFLSLEPNTLIYCIHNVQRSEKVEIHDMHHFPNNVIAIKD